jgi:hypothetical protein
VRHCARFHSGEAQRNQAAGSTDLNHDVLEIVVQETHLQAHPRELGNLQQSDFF